MKIKKQNKDDVSAEIALEECDNLIEIAAFNRKALRKILKSCEGDYVCLSYVDVESFDGKRHPDGETARMLIIDEEIAIIEE